jgi:hypothetical protein
VGEAVDPGDPVLHLEDLPDLLGLEVLLVVLDGAQQNALDLTRSKLGIRLSHCFLSNA